MEAIDYLLKEALSFEAQNEKLHDIIYGLIKEKKDLEYFLHDIIFVLKKLGKFKKTDYELLKMGSNSIVEYDYEFKNSRKRN